MAAFSRTAPAVMWKPTVRSKSRFHVSPRRAALPQLDQALQGVLGNRRAVLRDSSTTGFGGLRDDPKQGTLRPSPGFSSLSQPDNPPRPNAPLFPCFRPNGCGVNSGENVRPLRPLTIVKMRRDPTYGDDATPRPSGASRFVVQETALWFSVVQLHVNQLESHNSDHPADSPWLQCRIAAPLPAG
jgi:hypothetical protein